MEDRAGVANMFLEEYENGSGGQGWNRVRCCTVVARRRTPVPYRVREKTRRRSD